jgi:hypothetical protein
VSRDLSSELDALPSFFYYSNLRLKTRAYLRKPAAQRNHLYIVMGSVQRLKPSSRLALALSRLSITPPRSSALPQAFSHRLLNTSSRWHATADPTKPIVLEKPDKFRPPSHPQRLNRRAPRNYPGPALSETEREAQQTRSYPHTFPNPGTKLHWFLTTWWIHLWITMASLLSNSRSPCFY